VDGGFRSFLVGHMPLLAVTPTWMVRIVFAPFLQRVVPDYQRAVHQEVESRLDEQTMNDLQWYFFHTRRQTDWREYTDGAEAIKTRFARCRTAFAGPRFARLYRQWLTEREAALTPIPLAISEATAAGRAGLDCIVLPHETISLPWSTVARSTADVIRLTLNRAKRRRVPSTGPLTGSLTRSRIPD
jgi:hypothetical protein